MVLLISRKNVTELEYFSIICKVKLKWSRYRPSVAQRVGRGIALLFHDRGTRRGEWSAAGPGRTLTPGKTRYPFYRRLCGPQGRSGRAEYLVPTGIRTRIVQPVAQSLYRLSYPAKSASYDISQNAARSKRIIRIYLRINILQTFLGSSITLRDRCCSAGEPFICHPLL